MESVRRTAHCVTGACLLAVLSLTTCALPTGRASHDDGETMAALMLERLNWMDEVAAAKQANSLPVTDPKREADLLKAMEQRGAGTGLPTGAVRAFFLGQIEAARQVQLEWLEAHHGSDRAAGATVPDLTNTVRPALDEIGGKMILALARLRESEATSRVVEETKRRLECAGFSQAVIRPALQGLEAGLKR